MDNIKYANFLIKINSLDTSFNEEEKRELNKKTYFGETEENFFNRIISVILNSNVDSESKEKYFNNFINNTSLESMTSESKKFYEFTFKRDFIHASMDKNGEPYSKVYNDLKDLYMSYISEFENEAYKYQIKNEFVGLAISNNNIEDMKFVVSLK